jgi:transcriptional regulator with XRE-family HTH domain
MPKHDVSRRLGRRIRELRVEQDLTQEELAVRATITWHYVSAIERGTKAATVETLTAIAAALDLSLSELFLGVDRPQPSDVRRIATALAGQPIDAQRAILRLVEDALRLATIAGP